MTCIVGLLTDNDILFGADSESSSSYIRFTVQNPKVFIKSFSANQCEFVIGVSGSVRVGQILQFDFNPPLQSENEPDLQYLVQTVIPHVRTILREGGINSIINEVETLPDSTILIGYRGNQKMGLYTIYRDFQVAAYTDEYAAIGRGDELALGSLFTTQDNDNYKERLELALSAAAKFSVGVSMPFNYFSLNQKGRI